VRSDDRLRGSYKLQASRQKSQNTHPSPKSGEGWGTREPVVRYQWSVVRKVKTPTLRQKRAKDGAPASQSSGIGRWSRKSKTPTFAKSWRKGGAAAYVESGHPRP
jgi:hypothetical protein